MNEKSDLRNKFLANQSYDPKDHDYDFKFKPVNLDDPSAFFKAHTTVDVMRCLEHNPKIEIESKIICKGSNGSFGYKRFDSKQIREAATFGNKKWKEFREIDAFGVGAGGFGTGSTPLGKDFIPLLGGPFFKNQYYYTDYIQMHSEAFFAFHHDPVAKAITNITRDFVLGTGYEIQCDTDSPKGAVAMATWKAFEEVNNLEVQIDELCIELSVYGETMIRWLPNNDAKIVYQLNQFDTNPKGIIPRVRVTDPSNMIEIVTYPEDITRKLFYVWLTPTQYQIFTSGMGNGNNLSQPSQPTLKYIYEQVPADQMMHYKINAVSNEKRGRTDYFPILSYLKRLRDTVDFAIVSEQKNAAWSIDTEIDGDQADVDNYTAAMLAIGTIPPAGSDFVHSKAIKRTYLANTMGHGGVSNAFDWNLSLICVGAQIPIDWLGTHLSGGKTKATAVVSTEPVIKKIEKRREVIKRILSDMWDRVMQEAGLGKIEKQIIFPEIITQDRSQKILDIQNAEISGYIKKERAAAMVAKEMGIHNYNYKKEMEEIKKDMPMLSQPLLTAPGQIPPSMINPPQPNSPMMKSMDQPNPQSALTKNERKDIKTDGAKF